MLFCGQDEKKYKSTRAKLRQATLSSDRIRNVPGGVGIFASGVTRVIPSKVSSGRDVRERYREEDA